MNTEIIRLLDRLAPKEGFNRTPVEQVMLYRSETPIRRATLMYDPCVVIVAQRYKIGFLGTETFVYDSGNYLVVPTLLPFECDAEGSPEEPYLAMSVPLRYNIVGELINQMEVPVSNSASKRALIYAEKITDELENAALRLLQSLLTPCDAAVLGPQLVKEIIYRVLQADKSGLLFDIFSTGSNKTKITLALRYIHENLESRIDVESLAKISGMSATSFHEKFKEATSSSPLQYIKSVRLNRARDLVTFEGLTTSAAAYRVGYQSVSQFSREFKRYFGYKSKDSKLHYPIQKS